mgnify:FL=1
MKKFLEDVVLSKWLYRFLFNTFYFVLVLLVIQHLPMQSFYILFILTSLILMVINCVCDYRDVIDEFDAESKEVTGVKEVKNNYDI